MHRICHLVRIRAEIEELCDAGSLSRLADPLVHFLGRTSFVGHRAALDAVTKHITGPVKLSLPVVLYLETVLPILFSDRNALFVLEY